MKNVLKYIVMLLNIGLTVYLSGGYFTIVGIVLAMLSAITSIFCRKNKLGYFIIYSQIKDYDRQLLHDKEERNSLLITIAFLIFGIKVGIGIAFIIEGAAVLVLAFCILLASGWLIEGRKSGMSVGVAYYISKIITKIYVFVTSLRDKLVMAIVKLEFYVLKIEEW